MRYSQHIRHTSSKRKLDSRLSKANGGECVYVCSQGRHRRVRHSYLHSIQCILKWAHTRAKDQLCPGLTKTRPEQDWIWIICYMNHSTYYNTMYTIYMHIGAIIIYRYWNGKSLRTSKLPPLLTHNAPNISLMIRLHKEELDIKFHNTISILNILQYFLLA